MPGLQHPFAIETSDAETAIILVAWEMTKLALHNRIQQYTDDDVRAEYTKNYESVNAAHRARQSNTPVVTSSRRSSRE